MILRSRIVVAFCLAAACLAPPLHATGRWQILEDGEAGLHRYIWEHTDAPWSYQLDLTDAQQYAYVLHMLELGGESPEKSPTLYKKLAEAHTGTGTRRPTLPRFDEADATANSGKLVPINDIAYFRPKTDQDKSYEAEALSTYPLGTVMSHIVINLTAQEQGGATFFAKNAASAKTFTQGENFRVATGGTVPANITSDNITANILYLVQWKDHCPDVSDPDCSIKAIIATQELASLSHTGCLEAPMYKAYQGQNKCINQLGTTALATPLNLCWYRRPGNEGTCDYWNPEGRPTSFKIPIKGNASFDAAVDSVDFMDLTLQRTNGGGGCKLCGYNTTNKRKCPSGGGNVDVNQVTMNGNSIQWDWTGANAASFPNTANCIEPGTDPTWFNLEMWVTLNNTDFSQVQFASPIAGAPAQPEYPMPEVQIWNGCLEGDAKVTLADGKTAKAISSLLDLGGGKPEILSSGGATRGLEATTRGYEMIPMIRVTAGKHTLLLTQWHAVILADGTPVAAKDLKVGQIVQTLSGPQTVRLTGREAYERPIYNLKLKGTPQEVADGKTTFYANGILVGDAAMQTNLEKAARHQRIDRTPEEVRQALPPEWRQDYDNYLRGQEGGGSPR
jgi:hypothetical protein